MNTCDLCGKPVVASSNETVWCRQCSKIFYEELKKGN